MARAPTYLSRVASPGAPSIGIRPQALPNLPTSGVGSAIAATGTAALDFTATLAAAQAATRKAKSTSSYLDRLQELEDRYARDPDYQTAAARFDAEASELTGAIIAEANLPEPDQAELTLSFDRMRIASRGGVKARALAREAADNAAALDGMELSLSRQAASARSPTEQAAYVTQFGQAVDNAIANGWIGPQDGENYRQRFLGNVDETGFLMLLGSDPKAALAALDDPAAFAALDPVRRARYRLQAQGDVDQAIVDTVRLESEIRPWAVAATLNRVIEPAIATAIFERGVIPTESGGRADAVSPKNAIGVSQVLIGTARDMAPAIGRADLLDLNDADLKATLIADPELNAKIGETYFRKQLTAFDGNLALALAAYNAGPAKAEEWQAKAIEKFGADFTAGELLTVVSYGETRDYIGKVFARVGGHLEGYGTPSAHGYARAVAAAGEGLSAFRSQQLATIRNVVSADAGSGGFVDQLKAGLDVNADALGSHIARTRQLAENGDAGAQKELLEIEDTLAVWPEVQAIWQQDAATTEAMLAAAEEAVASAPTTEGMRQLAILQAVSAEVGSKINDDPLALLYRRDPKATLAIDPAAPIDRNFVSALAARGRQTEIAVNQFGGRALPFRPAEAAALAERWTAAGEGERFQILAGMASALPERALREGIGQLKLDGGATVAAMFANQRPELARKILRGKALLAVEGVQKATADLPSALARTLDRDLYPDPAMLADVVDAATAVYVADRGVSGSMFDATDTNALKNAIEEVAGELVTRNGVRVAAPPGMSGGDFERAIDDFGDARLADFGGARDRAGDPVTAADIAWSGIFRQLAPGASRYVVGFPDPTSPDGFAPLLTAKADKGGRIGPLVIDFAPPASRPWSTRRIGGSVTP